MVAISAQPTVTPKTPRVRHGESVLPTPPLSRSASMNPHSNSIDQPNHADRVIRPLDPLESSDPLRVRDALSKMDPTAFLDQISQPKRPGWQSVVGEWLPI